MYRGRPSVAGSKESCKPQNIKMCGSDYQSLPRLKGDHAKNAKDFLRAGIDAYSTEELSGKCKGVKGMIKNRPII